MLVKFTAANFLSFNNEPQTFSLESGKVRTKKDHLIVCENDISLLKFAAIFGANGSGKSNFIRAIDFLRRLVLLGTASKSAENYQCKINEENKDKPTFFEIEMLIENNIFTYGIKILLSSSKIESEYLYCKVANKKKYLFNKASEKEEYEFSGDLKGIGALKILAETWKESEKPFLYNINHDTQAFFNQNQKARILKTVFDWFAKNLSVTFPEMPIKETSLITSKTTLSDFEALLKFFDTGINSITAESVPLDKAFESLSPRDKTNIVFQMDLAYRLFLRQKPKGIPTNFGALIKNRRNIFRIRLDEKTGDFRTEELKFVHQYENNSAAFERKWESDGTARLFDLLEILVSGEGKVFIIDEINRCLHPALTVAFVKKFFESAQKKKVQLAVTTHEVRLMTQELLRRDEIWFAEKGEDKSTKMKCMDSENVRIDKKIDDAYMSGEYGSVPTFG